LKDGINNHRADPSNPNQSNQLVSAAKQMYSDLDSKGESFPPYGFVQTLRTLHPQFDETDNQGRHMQQDSEECFNCIMQSYENANMRHPFGDEDVNLIPHLFNIEMKITQPPTEENEEAKTIIEKAKELRCYIDNNNKPISHLLDGIKLSLGDSQRMNNLPPYLTINLVRFFWKKESTTAGTSAGKSKILRSVSFPMVLDVYDLCSEELKQSLDHGRKFENRLREEHDEKMLSGKAEEDAANKAAAEEAKAKSKDKDVKMEDAEEEKKETTKKKSKVLPPTINDEVAYRDHGTGLDHGKYQLMGVVTHQGRTADAGHYIGWVHSTGDEWYQCDDDFITRVKTQDILNLKGGGDWHMAYMLIYRKIEICQGDVV